MDTGETLYNGIQLPTEWPPRLETFQSAAEVTPPYLDSPPAVIPIDVGRQLFVDDFLIDNTTLTRVFHLPEYHPDNPVMAPETPCETVEGRGYAAPFSDGVWYDPADRVFKMWYMSASGPETCYGTCYATSTDGIHWERPALDASWRGSNVVKFHFRDSGTVWMDLDDPDPGRRFKMLLYGGGAHLRMFISPDGIQWSLEITKTGRSSDRSTMFYNPFRKVWVYSIRGGDKGLQKIGRIRSYVEHPEFGVNPWEAYEECARWASADQLDRIHPETGQQGEVGQTLPDLYNLDCIAYESLIVGQYSIHSRPQNDETGRPKLNHVALGFSRDGFYWHRPDRRAFMGMSEDPEAWNWGNVQSTTGFLVVGDRLYFYFSGRNSHTKPDNGSGMATGLAILRRDGFSSMEGSGKLTTRPVTFTGGHLFVNVDNPQGEMRVEVLDENGEVITPFTADNCVPVTADSTIRAVTWNDGDLSALAGKPVRFRFHLKDGKLYAFWVSPDESGASRGYVAAGGPGFTGHADTVGTQAYKVAKI